MANTYTLIASNTLSSSAASVTFSSIPNTYTDLVLRISARTDDASTSIKVNYNSNTANYSQTWLYTNNGTSALSFQQSARSWNQVTANSSSTTSNTFSNVEIYIPNYLSSNNKPTSSNFVAENNATAAGIYVLADLWRNTSAISSITLACDGAYNLVSGSSFFLYGIKNS